MFKKIFISGDHTAQNLILEISDFLKSKNIELEAIPLIEGDDYTDIAHQTSEKIIKTQDSCGILICGSGIGVSMAANKHKGIRAALCHTELLASLARKHNNANILCLGARFLDIKNHIAIINTFFTTKFEGGRHNLRVQKIEPKN